MLLPLTLLPLLAQAARRRSGVYASAAVLHAHVYQPPSHCCSLYLLNSILIAASPPQIKAPALPPAVPGFTLSHCGSCLPVTQMTMAGTVDSESAVHIRRGDESHQAAHADICWSVQTLRRVVRAFASAHCTTVKVWCGQRGMQFSHSAPAGRTRAGVWQTQAPPAAPPLPSWPAAPRRRRPPRCRCAVPAPWGWLGLRCRVCQGLPGRALPSSCWDLPHWRLRAGQMPAGPCAPASSC